MADTTAASVGFVLAGLALGAALLGWPLSTAAAGLAGVALVGFGLRRYGVIEPVVATAVAAAALVGVIALGGRAVVVGGGSLPAVGTGLAAGGALAFAYADYRGLDRGDVTERLTATVRGVVVGGIGIIAIFVWGFIVFVVASLVVPGEIGPSGTTVLSTLASGAGTVSVVLGYLHYTDREFDYLDIRWPTRWGVLYAVVGTVAILGGNLLIGAAFQRFGVDSASHTIVQTAEADPTVLLFLIPLSYLAIGPGEELLYRNIVQKSLRETFSPVAGVVVASVVFAAVHLPAYSSPDASLGATLSTLLVIFVLALILGAIYERTGNVVVTAFVHGTFNAIAFAVTYAQLTGQLPA